MHSKLTSSFNSSHQTKAETAGESEGYCLPDCKQHMLRLDFGEHHHQTLPRKLVVRLCSSSHSSRESLVPRPNLLQEIYFPMFVTDRHVSNLRLSAVQFEQTFDKWKHSHYNFLDVAGKATEKLD